MQKTQILSHNVSFDPSELCLPCWVQDGERNAWIVRLALIYKWAGYSQECTLKKVTLRVQGIPGFEGSRNCKQLSNIVRSLFRRQPETLGIRERKSLPDWIIDDKKICSILERLSTRRGVTPGGNQASGYGSCVSVPQSLLSPYPCFETPCELFETALVQKASKTLWVVRRKQRIGIFDGSNLVLCLTKTHYKASRVIEHLSHNEAVYRGLDIRLVAPRKIKQAMFFDSVDSAEFVQQGEHICGRKETLCESLQKWRERKGVHEIRVEPIGEQEFDVPF